MADDALDGTLGRTGHEPPPFLHGSLADLTARANAAGFPTVSTWVDHLERNQATTIRPVEVKTGHVYANGVLCDVIDDHFRHPATCDYCDFSLGGRFTLAVGDDGRVWVWHPGCRDPRTSP